MDPGDTDQRKGGAEPGPHGELLHHMAEIAELVRALEAAPDSAARRHAFALLEHIDALHRLGLTRLLALAEEMGVPAWLDHWRADPVVGVLLEIYGLVPGGVTGVQRLIDAHLAEDGQPAESIEVVDTADGIVRVRVLTPAATLPTRLGGLIERMLRRDMAGFRELVVLEPPREGATAGAPAAGATPKMIPLSGVRRAARLRSKRTVAVPILGAADLRPGDLRGVEVRGRRILVCCLASAGPAPAFRAYEDRCPGSALPLSLGQLEGAELRCPWHGCRYDALTGAAIGPGRPLVALPLKVGDQGQLIVELEAEPELERLRASAPPDPLADASANGVPPASAP